MAKAKPLIDEDGEVRELTLEDFKHFRPISEVLPPSLLKKLQSRPTVAVAEGPRPRAKHGTTVQLVEEVLQAMAPRAARPAEIRNALRRDRGVTIAFASIRDALGQLEACQTVEHVVETKAWRYRKSSNAPHTLEQ